MAVNPTALDPLPEVYIPLGAILNTCCNSCDFAVEGSPTRQMLISALNLPLPDYNISFFAPPNNCANIPFLISLFPWIEGAKLSTNN